MTHFWAIYAGRLLGNSMKSMSFPIPDAWLVKVVTCVIITQVFGLKDEIADSRLLYVVLNALAA